MATFKYANVSWVSLYRTEIKSSPEQDDAKRTTVATRHEVFAHGVIAGDFSDQMGTGDLEDNVGTDALMTALRKRLTKQGAELHVENTGFGKLHVGGSGTPCLRGGPIPEVVSWKPLGGSGMAAEVEFRVTCWVGECDQALRNSIMAINTQPTYHIDGDGYTPRLVCAGYIEIKMGRTSEDQRTLPDCVDRYRQLVERRTVPLGFKRTQQEYRVSADRRRLDFTFVDEEQPTALPNYVSKMDFREKASAKELLSQQWIVQYTAEITMARGAPRREALKVFFDIVYSRIRERRSAMFMSMDIENIVTGRASRFMLTIKYIHAAAISTVLERYSFWEPFRGASWEAWRGTMYVSRAWTSRGNAGLEEKKEQDSIVDLCITNRRELSGPSQRPPGGAGPSRPTTPGRNDSPTRDPANTWLYYECWLIWSEQSSNAVHKPLPTQPVNPAPTGAGRPPFGGPGRGLRDIRPRGESGRVPALRPFPETRRSATANNAAGDSGRSLTGGIVAHEGRSPNLPGDIVQKAASASRRCRLVGYGTRLGYEVPMPRLVSVGGSAVVELSRNGGQGVVAHFDGEPVYCSWWDIEYLVPDAPTGTLPVPANPWMDQPGTG